MMPPSASLCGRKVLVVEDEYLIAMDLCDSLRAAGAEVVDSVATVEAALELIAATADLDAAILDINLRGKLAFAVADALAARHVPFLFATGYNQAAIPPRFAHVAHCEKPMTAADVVRTLGG